MQDAIIKGNGNSRYLKTVAAALSLYPTYEDMLQAMIAGTFPIDLNGINAEGWTQQGTPMNKASLLPDSTATSLGLGTDATVADALSVIPPTGSVFWFASETIPGGYLKCDGSVVSRTDYARLFEVIGTKFGAGDGSTTFALPDLRAKFVRGAGTWGGVYTATFGATQTATTIDTHSYYSESYANGIGGIYSYDYRSSIDGTSTMSSITGGKYSYRYAIRPVNIALTPIIKY